MGDISVLNLSSRIWEDDSNPRRVVGFLRGGSGFRHDCGDRSIKKTIQFNN